MAPVPVPPLYDLENYGTTWSVDHVLPLSGFDMTKEKERSIAFHWTNMQPSLDNFEKGSKLRIHEYFNVMISAHRFMQNKRVLSGYQNLSESLGWLREKLRHGHKSPDEPFEGEIDNSQPSS